MKHFIFTLLAVLLSNAAFAQNQETPNEVKLTTDKSNPHPVNIAFGQTKLSLFGYAQSTYAVENKNHETTNGFEVQRIILMSQLDINKRLGFFIMYDFNSAKLHEYWAKYTFAPGLEIRIGQMKQPFTLENLMPPTLLSVVRMNQSVAYLAGIAGDPCFGNWVGRDAGIMLTGFLLPHNGRHLLQYNLGVFNGAGMNQKENNSQKDVIGMLNYMPTKDITLSSSFILGTGHALVDSPYGAFKAGDNYKRNRWSAGVEAKTKPAYLRGEWLQGNDGGIHSRGGYADAEIHVAKKLDIIADYNYLQKNNDIKASTTHTYTGGLQYWLYKQCRIQTEFSYAKQVDGPASRLWITQFQVAF